MNYKENYPLISKSNPMECIAGKISRCNRAISNIYRKYLNKHDITQSQLGILFLVGKMQIIPQSEISKFLHIGRSTTSRDLVRLISKGNIIKSGPANRPILKITNEGAALLEKIIPDWEKALEESKNILGEDGQEAVNLILQKLT